MTWDRKRDGWLRAHDDREKNNRTREGRFPYINTSERYPFSIQRSPGARNNNNAIGGRNLKIDTSL